MTQQVGRRKKGWRESLTGLGDTIGSEEVLRSDMMQRFAVASNTD